MAQDTYLYGKRDLRIWQKRPTCIATSLLTRTHTAGTPVPPLAQYLETKLDLAVAGVATAATAPEGEAHVRVAATLEELSVSLEDAGATRRALQLWRQQVC